MEYMTETQKFWDQQPLKSFNPEEVNINDTLQRKLEYQFVMPHLNLNHLTLEVGCGNGFSSNFFREKVKFLDAFDQSKNMISSAKELYGETNNRFFIDNITNLDISDNKYDTVIDIRVLINLANLDEQIKAFKELTRVLKPGGNLIFIEGFSDGFKFLSEERISLNMPAIEPAKINFYSSINDLMPLILNNYSIIDEFNSGTYDYYTRIIYPYLVGLDNITKNIDIKEKLFQLGFNNSFKEHKKYARLCGFVLKKK